MIEQIPGIELVEILHAVLACAARAEPPWRCVG